MLMTTDGSVRFNSGERYALAAAAEDWHSTGWIPAPGTYLDVLVRLGHLLSSQRDDSNIIEGEVISYGEDTAAGEETCEREEAHAIIAWEGEGGGWPS